MSETLSVDCRGCPARVEIVGSGPAIVIVGTAVPMSWAMESCRAMAARGFRVLNFDYSPPEDWESEPVPRTALDQVADVVAVMEATAIEHAHIVGLSRGAMTAFALAARYPGLVDTLTLAFPVAGFADTILVEDTLLEGHSDDPLLEMLSTVFSDEFLSSNFDEAKSLLLTPPGTVERVGREDEEVFTSSDTVSAPTLVIEGGADKVVSAEHSARYLAAVEGATHVVVEEANHGWLMEEPEVFADIVAEFLRRQSP